MTVYERVEAGEVVEVVASIPGGHEDTRLGVAVLEGRGGWRIQGEDEPQSEPPAIPAEPAEPAPEVSTDADVRDRGGSGRPARNRRARER